MTDEQSSITGTLENWWYDKGWMCFRGNLYGDTRGRWVDGQHIYTSHCPMPEAKEGDIIKTMNSFYLLGRPFSD